MTILFVDDLVDDRKIFLMALRALDGVVVKLRSADTGVEALEMIHADKKFIPDFIFLDLNMPYMSGKECLTELRKIERLKDSPIIIYSSVQDFEELKGLGASSFIKKQNSVPELSKILSDIIKDKSIH